MTYRLVITQRAEELLENIILYVAVKLSNRSAAADYVILFKVEAETVTIEGIFHELENYGKKI